jgi:hypothetical protein
MCLVVVLSTLQPWIESGDRNVAENSDILVKSILTEHFHQHRTHFHVIFSIDPSKALDGLKWLEDHGSSDDGSAPSSKDQAH